VPWVVKKRLNRSIYRLSCGLEWAEGSTSSVVFARWRQCAHLGGQIPVNRPSAAEMRSYVKLLWPLVETLPAFRNIAGDMFVFHQDSAPAHHARDSRASAPWDTEFISPDMWPANSSELNSVITAWCRSVYTNYQVPVRDTDDLRQRTVETWAEFQQCGGRCDWSVAKKDMEACIHAEGGHWILVMTLRAWHSSCHTTQLAVCTAVSGKQHNSLFSEPPTFGGKQYTFHQTNEFCISRGV